MLEPMDIRARLQRDWFDQLMTSTTTNTEQPTLTMEGMLYQLAIFAQNLERNPIATAFRAEPCTLARLQNELQHHVPKRSAPSLVPEGLGYFDGIRLEEDNELPPRPPGRIDVIDQKGRIMQIIEMSAKA